MPKCWYALQVRSQHEALVLQGLDLQGIEHFYPTYAARSTRGRRQVSIQRSLFPGYLFVRLGSNRDCAAAISVMGVVRIVSIGLEPAPIPDSQIEAVRTLLASPMSVTPCPFEPLNSGDSVVIKYGPLMGVEGKVIAPKGKTHVLFVVSIVMLGRSVQATIPREQIQLISKGSKVVQMGGSFKKAA